MNKQKGNVIIWLLIVLLVVGGLVYLTINKAGTPAGEEPVNTQNNMDNNAQVAKSGDVVSMNYTGKLESGVVFDSNVDPKFNHVQPFEFTLGAGQVIKGWDKGIVGMKVGEKKTLTISPEDAYGAGGIPGVIPPNSTLLFDVELLSIKSGN